MLFFIDRLSIRRRRSRVAAPTSAATRLPPPARARSRIPRTQLRERRILSRATRCADRALRSARGCARTRAQAARRDPSSAAGAHQRKSRSPERRRMVNARQRLGIRGSIRTVTRRPFAAAIRCALCPERRRAFVDALERLARYRAGGRRSRAEENGGTAARRLIAPPNTTRNIAITPTHDSTRMMSPLVRRV